MERVHPAIIEQRRRERERQQERDRRPALHIEAPWPEEPWERDQPAPPSDGRGSEIIDFRL